jgi:hypothetical protein
MWVPFSRRSTPRLASARPMTEVDLGPDCSRQAVSLSDARQKARTLWDIHKEGRDPLAERRAGRAAITAASIGKGRTFKEAAADYIEAYRGAWRSSLTERQWQQSLSDYVFPTIGQFSVDTFTTSHVANVLRSL